MPVGALAICFSPTPALDLQPQGEKILIIYPALAKEEGCWEDKEAAGAGSEGEGGGRAAAGAGKAPTSSPSRWLASPPRASSDHEGPDPEA